MNLKKIEETNQIWQTRFEEQMSQANRKNTEMNEQMKETSKVNAGMIEVLILILVQN